MRPEIVVLIFLCLRTTVGAPPVKVYGSTGNSLNISKTKSQSNLGKSSTNLAFNPDDVVLAEHNQWVLFLDVTCVPFVALNKNRIPVFRPSRAKRGGYSFLEPNQSTVQYALGGRKRVNQVVHLLEFQHLTKAQFDTKPGGTERKFKVSQDAWFDDSEASEDYEDDDEDEAEEATAEDMRPDILVIEDVFKGKHFKDKEKLFGLYGSFGDFSQWKDLKALEDVMKGKENMSISVPKEIEEEKQKYETELKERLQLQKKKLEAKKKKKKKKVLCVD
eukprot:Platyproteum_vivax@DN2964_c0_g1_i2.p1